MKPIFLRSQYQTKDLTEILNRKKPVTIPKNGKNLERYEPTDKPSDQVAGRIPFVRELVHRCYRDLIDPPGPKTETRPED